MCLDIRTKTVVLIAAGICAVEMKSIYFQLLIILGIGILQVLAGKNVFSVKFVLVYFMFLFIQLYIMPVLPPLVSMMLSIPVVQARKLFPSAMAIIFIVKTTQVNHLISTMTKMKVPKSITITLAVTLRYFPVIKEEWGYIKDAMRIRNISTSYLNPAKSIMRKMECYYVPLLISASKTAEDLTTAAVTRGIENPKPGTCRGYQRLASQDYGVMLAALLFIGAGIII